MHNLGPHRQWAFGPCFYCGRLTFKTDKQVPWQKTRDHLLPSALRKDIVNPITVVACYSCNHTKHDILPEKFFQTIGSPITNEKRLWIQEAYRQVELPIPR